MPRHYCTLFAEEDRAPQALLAAPPTQLLMGVEDMQRAFWQGTDQGRGMLHQVRGEGGCRLHGIGLVGREDAVAHLLLDQNLGT